MEISAMSGIHPLPLPRPQVGIERLPTQRMNNEPRESMNCKSCRKRKIKCNRMRPACEACQVFQCPCVYDAVPKKRGPKTDVLEALLKRVDGLEAKLKEKNDEESSRTTGKSNIDSEIHHEAESGEPSQEREPSLKRPAHDPSSPAVTDREDAASITPKTATSKGSPTSVSPDAVLDTYFAKLHAKPYCVLDESSVRQRMQLNQLPSYLYHAIAAVSVRYALHPRGYQAAVKQSEDFATQARRELDLDEPSVDGLQALVLLILAFTAAGKGKKAYMLMTSAVGMAMALELHRESDIQARTTPVEREMRRRLFWTCYLLDRYSACGSKRSSFITDKTIMLRLPSWSPNPSTLAVEGEFFQSGSNLQYFQGNGRKSQGSTGMLIDITRILGVTNRYLAAGGVKGDSHFPWHSLSNLSKIRHDLDVWASGTDDVFTTIDALFGQADSTILVFSKLIYHLVHCLIYRPFLPIDLAELAGSGQHQSWQIEATNMCFLHANAIAELIDLGNQASTIEWPAFVGYCICTAGTVHIHGAHYSKQGGGTGEMNVFSSSPDFLSREMQQLGELRHAWASVQHQRETLQGIYNAHAELVKTLTGNSTRYTPGFHLEDFFDRYSNIGGPGGQSYCFDAANLILSDAVMDYAADVYAGHDTNASRSSIDSSVDQPPPLKRRNTGSSSQKRRPDMNTLGRMDPPPHGSGHARRSISHHSDFNNSSPALLTTPGSMMVAGNLDHQHSTLGGISNAMGSQATSNVAAAAAAAASFGMSNAGHTGHGQALPPMDGTTAFTPSYTFSTGHQSIANNHGAAQVMGEHQAVYDPIFGGVPTNAFSSPAAWQGGDDAHHQQQHQHNGGNTNRLHSGTSAGLGQPATSPGQKSNTGSTGTTHGDEKDPFLSLLEQLAENEQHFGNGVGSDLDFFLAGTGSGM